MGPFPALSPPGGPVRTLGTKRLWRRSVIKVTIVPKATGLWWGFSLPGEDDLLSPPCSPPPQVIAKHLPPDQLLSLLLSMLEGLADPDRNCSRAAAVMINSVLKERGVVLLEKVGGPMGTPCSGGAPPALRLLAGAQGPRPSCPGSLPTLPPRQAAVFLKAAWNPQGRRGVLGRPCQGPAGGAPLRPCFLRSFGALSSCSGRTLEGQREAGRGWGLPLGGPGGP